MAVLANISGLQVRLILARGLGTVVAVDAVAGDVDVIKIRWQPACCGVAVIAGIAAGDMIRVLTWCREAVVTRTANSYHLRVVDGVDGREYIAIVTVLANVCCLNMRHVLAGSVSIVMTAGAIGGNVDVIEIRRCPASGRMTVVTAIACIQVRRSLATGRAAVVARTTGADNLGVINGKHRCKYVGRVAILADIAGLDVPAIFARGFRTVVAADAVTANIYVVEVRR